MKEIERKYLVTSMDFVREATEVIPIDQGYLHAQPPTVRVRLWGEQGFITIKGGSDPLGLAREEYEYEIPPTDARAMLALCDPPLVEKTRYVVDVAGRRWEVDVFTGRHEGLVLAEIELSSIGEQYDLPPWVGEEVTGDPRYYNAMLARKQ